MQEASPDFIVRVFAFSTTAPHAQPTNRPDRAVFYFWHLYPISEQSISMNLMTSSLKRKTLKKRSKRPSG